MMRRNYFRGRSSRQPACFPTSNEDENMPGSTVSDEKRNVTNFRKWIRNKLEAFLLSGENELKLDPMNCEERRITHIMARKLDLRSVSRGKEPERYMTIKRSRTKGGIFSCLSMNETQSLTLHTNQKEKIRNFLAEFPVESHHIEEHFALNDHKKRNKKNGQIASYRSQKLVPPLSNMNPDIEQFRMSLPTYRLRKDILHEIETHKVTLITGGTGCGKTTQIPQFILEESYALRQPLRIMCTQPRRLPAIAVSKRVAVERGERLGSTVGYHIRLEQKTSAETVLTYCTSGVLLRMLMVDELASDMTHIILDEIHEREQNTDYLLIALKHALRKRHDLKIILMSATMEGNLSTFMNYFDSTTVGYIDIPSRLYNVEKFDLADVLALTGYMPRSIFGGLFSANFSQNDSMQSFTYDTFPQVSEFRSDDKSSDLMIFNSDNYGRQFQGNHSMELHSTEPNLSSYYSNSSFQQHSQGFSNNSFYSGNQVFSGPQNRSKSPDIFCTSGRNFGNFGFNSQQSCNANDVAAYLDRILPNRLDYFDSKIVPRLRKAEINKNALISTYLNSGGQQWADSVDVDLAVDLIRYLVNSPIDGSILVFLPGYDDIVQVRDQMTLIMHELRVKPVIFTLHSQINTQEQQKVFEKVSYGSRKVILSTNIAEASLTINDVVFVIDCGKVKEKTYDHTTRITQLKVAWIAKSNAEQRAGRAGRCRNGYCFRLYSKRDFDSMLETQIPEMKRSAIHDVCLHAKMFAPENMPVKKFLEMAPEPPPPLAVDHSLEFLEQLGALYFDKDKQNQQNFSENYYGHSQPSSAAAFFGRSSFRSSKNCLRDSLEPELTELGRVLAHLPLEPQCARLLLFGLALKCLNPVVTLVASLSHRDPFVLPMGDERTAALNARDEFGRRDFSDHLMLIRAFYAYASHSNHTYQFCRANFLSPQAMKMIQGIRRQLILELKRLHFLPPNVNNHDDPEVNLYSNCWPMIQGAIVAGCYPGIGFVKAGSKLRKIRTNADVNASLHPSSVIKRQILITSKRSELITRYGGDTGDPVIEYLAYQELSKIDEGLTLRMVTVVPPLTVLLFAGPIRLSKEIVESFELAEEDISPEELKKPCKAKKHTMQENSNCDNYDLDWCIPTSAPDLDDTENSKPVSEKIQQQLPCSLITSNSGSLERLRPSMFASALELTAFSADPDDKNKAKNSHYEESSSTNIIVEDAGNSASQSAPLSRADSNLKKEENIDDIAHASSNAVQRFFDHFANTTSAALKDKGNISLERCNSALDKTDDQQSENLNDPFINNVSPILKNTDFKDNNDLDTNNKMSKNLDVDDEDDEDGLNHMIDDDDYNTEHVMELESWLAFKGPFDTMQSLARLRFKLMSYFLSVLKNPARETTTEDFKLLECLSEVLTMDHKKNNFYPCDDLPKPRLPKMRQQFSSNDNNSSFEEGINPTTYNEAVNNERPRQSNQRNSCLRQSENDNVCQSSSFGSNSHGYEQRQHFHRNNNSNGSSFYDRSRANNGGDRRNDEPFPRNRSYGVNAHSNGDGTNGNDGNFANHHDNNFRQGNNRSSLLSQHSSGGVEDEIFYDSFPNFSITQNHQQQSQQRHRHYNQRNYEGGSYYDRPRHNNNNNYNGNSQYFPRNNGNFNYFSGNGNSNGNSHHQQRRGGRGDFYNSIRYNNNKN